MKILFLIEPFIVEPLAIGYLSSVLKKEGHEVDITRPNSMWEDILNFKPDLMAISATTGQHIRYLELAREIKKHYPEIKIVFGGAHPTYFPEIAKEDCIDFIIRGEGEVSFLKLVKAIGGGQILPGKERQIEPLIEDINTIPFPDRKLIYKYPENYNNPIKNVFTSRGCPFSCTYCYLSAFRELYKGQQVVRHRSIDNIITECKELKEKYPTKFIFFADDEFAVSGERLQEFSDKYKKEIGVPFHCQLRIDYLTEEKVKTLKEAGCYSVTFAIESGNQVTRWVVLNKKITDKQIIKGVELLKRYNLRFRIENIIGLPGELIENALNTLRLNTRCGGTYNWVSLYQPYPKTKLGELCKTMDLFDGKTDDFKENFFEDTVLAIDKKEKFINLQRLFAVFSFFKIPIWLVRLLISFPKNKLYDTIFKVFKKWRYKSLYGC